MMTFRRGSSIQPLVHRLPLKYLILLPILFSLLAFIILSFHSDINTPLLYSQCHSRSRLPSISRIPVIGAPTCFLVSFFIFASSSIRAIAQLGAILSFVGALLTVTRVEAARKCNKKSWNITNPLLSWLVFNLAGGTVVWDLWIVPVFLSQAKANRLSRAKDNAISLPGGGSGRDVYEDTQRIISERSLSEKAEVFAIPIAVLLGFGIPSLLMLVFHDVLSVLIWLFFPLWVEIVHWVVLLEARRIVPENGPVYIDSEPMSIVVLYTLPVAASVAFHVFVIYNLFSHDDGREMTRTALKFIEIDFAFIAATIVYWVLVEAGLIPAAILVVLSFAMGPGAALCVVWTLREKAIVAFALSDDEAKEDSVSEESDGDDSTVHENTPLL
ncbi:hypothetical protein GGR57DRAFT_480981 [Xylariaceae sp. FL1272]|nr:hypothetical protein GGR57DRAFT_480981 [Xylariaceae sp. FL1272]